MANPGTAREVVFGSKVDAFIALVYLFYIGVCVASGMAFARYGRTGWPGLLVCVAMAPGALLMVWTFLTTSYRITERELIVKSGPWRKTIPLGLIASAKPVRDWTSAMALSIDRLEVRSESGTALVLISPREPRRFTDELLRRARAARASATA